MKKAHVLRLSLASTLALLALPDGARAQPQSITCTGQSPCFGVTAQGTGDAAWAIRATSFNSIGLIASRSGVAATATGVQGEAINGNGVMGKSESAGASGVFGFNTGQGFGVAGRTTGTGSAVFGDNAASNGFAGNFNGRVGVSSDLIVHGVPRANQTTFTLLSDARLKKNVQPLAGSLDKLLALRGVTYEWKDPAKHGNLTGAQVGFIAQDVEKAFPAWVSPNPDGFKTITPRGMDALVVESIRALKQENDALRGRLAALENGRSVARASIASDPLALGALGLAAIALLALVRWRARPGRPSGSAT
jgi:hypothetical protein